jgi:hypothetical protein
MRCCAVFFMGNSLSDPKDLLIPFIVTNSMSVFTVALISEPHSTVQTPQLEGGAPSSAYFAGEQQSLRETHPVSQHRLVFLWESASGGKPAMP